MSDQKKNSLVAQPSAEGFAYARAAAWVLGVEPRVGCVVQSSSEVQCSGRAECGTPRPRPTALAATMVFPLDSPHVRGVQRTLPLVAFLWNPKTVSFRNRKEMVFALRSLCLLSAKQKPIILHINNLRLTEVQHGNHCQKT